MAWLIFTTITGLIVSILIYYKLFSSLSYRLQFLKDVSCYNKLDQYMTLQAHRLNVTEKTIYFLETSCSGRVNSRQACVVESASRSNPDWTIYVMMSGPLDPRYLNSSTFSSLKSLKNVFFVRLNVTELIKGSIVETLFKSNIIFNGDHPVEHSSDILRILILNKYGGLYLDIDIIVAKSFNGLPINFVVDAKISDKHITNAVLRFTNYGIGKKFTDLILENQAKTFDPIGYSANGPPLITRLLKTVCDNTQRWSSRTCQGIDVLEKDSFFPINGDDWLFYYEDMQVSENPASYGYHVFKLHAPYYNIMPKSLFAKLAEKYCPNINKLHGTAFKI